MPETYVLHGWKVSQSFLTTLFTTPEIQEEEIQVLIPPGSMDAYVGELLLKCDPLKQSVGVAAPDPDAATRMRAVLERHGLGNVTSEAPLVWVVSG